jgi:Tfp pilus assembly protein PilF
MQSFSSSRRSYLGILVLVPALLLQLSARETAGQGASNQMGNGGIHTIQGRIFLSSGRRSDVFGLRIRLLNVASNDLSVIADSSGTFTFKYLLPGSYSVVVDGGDKFESVTESVFIDDPGSSNLSNTIRLRGGAKIANVQIYLKPKMSAEMLAAAEVINAKLAQVPKAARDLFESAQRSAGDNNDTQAIAQLRNAIAIHQNFSMAWNLLGLLLQKSADTPGAIEAFRSAVKFDGESAAANLNLGCALYNSKDYVGAEKHLVASILKNSASYRAHYYMGLTQMKLGRIDVAEQAFRTAIQVGDEQAAMAHYMLGGIYWSVKRYKEAADELERYLKLDPKAKDAEKTRKSIDELRRKS